MGCLTPGDIHVLFLIINEEKKIIIYKIKIKYILQKQHIDLESGSDKDTKILNPIKTLNRLGPGAV